MSVDNIHNLPNSKTTGQMARDLIAVAPDVIETQVVIAQMRRASYLASIAEGFTENQALFLCQNLFAKGG